MSTQICVFTGDLLNRQTNKNKRRHSLIASTEEEFNLGFSEVFKNLEQSNAEITEPIQKPESEYPKIQCSNYPRCHEFNVKVFLQTVTSGVVNMAVTNVLSEMNFTFVDSLIVSLGNCTNKQIDETWKQMEAMVCKNKLNR
jgi:hypothetical protein